MNKSNLPPNWSWVILGDVCNKITDGTHFTPKYIASGIPFISVKDIYDDKIHFNNCRYISIEEHTALIKRCNPELNDVLITKSGTIGRIAIVNDKKEFSLFVSVALLKPKSGLINSSFLALALKNYINSIDISQTIKGGLLKNYHIEDIKVTEIPLPPLPEQKKIVEKIEELFSGLDSGVASLKKAKAQIRLYRQSVLASAFSGKLTQKAQHQAHSGSLAAEPKVEYSNQLPDGWKWVKLGEVAIFSQGIQVPVENQKMKSFIGGVRFLRIIDFTQGNQEERYIKDPGEKYKVNRTDLSMVRYGASTGFICRGLEGVIANNLFRILPSNKINKANLFYFFKSPLFQEKLESSLKGAAMPAISFNFLNNLLFPLAPLNKQTQIVEEIEKRFSEADNLEKAMDDSLTKSETLRQSILKQAFEGKLV
jgi:restriction endonuclease S subunit